MAVLSRFIYSLSESEELRWVLLPRRRSGFQRVSSMAPGWVFLRASSLQNSSTRPFSVMLRLKADAFLWCGASVLSLCFDSVWRQSRFFQLRVLFLLFSKTSSEVVALGCSRWSSLWHAWICSHPSIT
ncbi:hypothetical protein F2Q69_00037513 [Brassica cretica]|uniref:Uncharacterized protein n=1 Tax=Brassica cretica TaxID=69181 RepID=A0A8S9SMT4_BRACR|nr:hypothetical protein F2Q69_00037513 [Brassica cretica]